MPNPIIEHRKTNATARNNKKHKKRPQPEIILNI